jgi:hypothetical protein
MKDLQEDDLEMDEDESMAAKAALKYVILTPYDKYSC